MRESAIAALLAVALGVSSCAYYDDYGYGSPPSRYGDYVYDGADYGRPASAGVDLRVHGPGASILDPWLALTAEGRAILAAGFDMPRDGFVPDDVAARANVWFRRYADHNRDMRLTDEEIRTALAHSASAEARGGY